MQKSLIVLCTAAVLALVGCKQNQGTADSEQNRNTGFGASRETTYPNSPSTRDTNSSVLEVGTSGISTNTNNAAGAPGSIGNPSPGSSGVGTQPPQN